jgi:predicted GNAT family N-acyltransferase
MKLHQIDSLTPSQIRDLHALYQQEWWTQGRKLADVERMIERCEVMVGFAEDETGRLVAFARVITDYVYKALLLDVIVAQDYRGQHLGTRLMDAVLEHPALQSVRHIELYCLPELKTFYQQWGFTADLGNLRFMRRG